MSAQFQKQFATEPAFSQPGYGGVMDWGLTVPTDGTAGYVPGCLFVKLDGTAGAAVYVNEGSLTSCDFNALNPVSGVVNVTASTLAVTKAAHANKIVTLNRAAGIAVTLPAASGTGDIYTFIIGTTVSGGTTTITRAGSDTIFGTAISAQDGGDTVVMFEAAGSTVITVDGSTQGGIKGDQIVLTDIASATWQVQKIGAATGTEATPFS
jgi:hypothetical protein